MKQEIKWFKEPEEHDYPAALSYLRLIFDDKSATEFVVGLKRAKMTEFKAKDIFRASRLSLLPTTNFHVKKNLKKIKNSKKMTPLLLVRDTLNGNVIIADGYHRLCATYDLNEDILIPCKIV